MRGIVKVFVVWTLGLAVLLGSTGVGLALRPKFQPGKTYCQCACRNATGTADLTWQKVASCNINGKSCSFNNPNNLGKLEPGKLDDCMSCQADSGGGLLCSAAPGSGLRTPREGLLDPPKTIMPRGVEGEPAQEEKAPAPK
jgi:hypothetical protein